MSGKLKKAAFEPFVDISFRAKFHRKLRYTTYIAHD